MNLLRLTFAVLLLVLVGPTPVRAQTNHLRWLARSNLVEARIQGIPLNKVLARVARTTGWEILVEPGTQRSVTAGFSGLSQREALARILGDLNFALLPRTNAPSRLLIFRSSRDRATEIVEADPDELKEGPIPEEFIVRVKAGLKLKVAELARVAKQLGGELVAGIDQVGAYRLRFPTAEAAEAARKAISEMTDGISMEDNFRIAPPESPPQPATGTGASGVTVPPLNTKNGVTVALIDTAVQALPAEMEALVASRIRVAPGQSGNGELLHGTSMFEAMVGGMQAAGEAVRIRTYDVYGGSETTSTFDVARALILAAQDGASVFNLSLGSGTPSPVLSDVIAQLAGRGGLVFAAAGNVPGTRPIFPAADPFTWAVTALDPSGQPASYANTGAFVDLAAPGTAIVHYGGLTYLVTGTSSATAWTSGYAAGLAAKNNAAPRTVVGDLQSQLGFGGKKP